MNRLIVAGLLLLVGSVLALADEFEEARAAPIRRVKRPTVICETSSDRINAKLETLPEGTYTVSAPSVSDRADLCVVVSPK